MKTWRFLNWHIFLNLPRQSCIKILHVSVFEIEDFDKIIRAHPSFPKTICHQFQIVRANGEFNSLLSSYFLVKTMFQIMYSQ